MNLYLLEVQRENGKNFLGIFDNPEDLSNRITYGLESYNDYSYLCVYRVSVNKPGNIWVADFNISKGEILGTNHNPEDKPITEVLWERFLKRESSN